MKYLPVLGMFAFLTLTAAAAIAQEEPSSLAESADSIAQKYMLVDTHIDVPYRLHKAWVDVTRATSTGDFDYPRAREGGLNTPFMSIYTPAESEAEGTSYQLANELIDSMQALVGRAPTKFALVNTADEAQNAMEHGLIGLAMGMENGSPLDGKLENVAFFRNRGVSYITLTHGLSNQISDSSYDTNHQWNGLSPFGKEVVSEMNRQGIMIDISHVSDDAFWQALEISEVPLIASHSSARHFTPGWERNMSDEMIKALAEKGGVIQINFGSTFLNQKARAWSDVMSEARKTYLAENDLDEESEAAGEFDKSYRQAHPMPYATLDDLVANFQHVIELAGVEHVGIGSDFDGVGDSLPIGMKSVADYPHLIEALLKRGYSVDDIAGIMGGNLLRVWRAAQAYAEKSAVAPASP